MKNQRFEFRLHRSSAFLVVLFASGGTLITEITKVRPNTYLVLAALVGLVISSVLVFIIWIRIQSNLPKRKK